MQRAVKEALKFNGRRVYVFNLDSVHSTLVNLAARRILIAADMIKGLKKGSEAPIPLPTVYKKWTLLKSPFKYKRAQDTLEQVMHRRMVSVECENDEVAFAFLEHLGNVIPPGVSLKIQNRMFHKVEELYNTTPFIAKEVTTAPPQKIKTNKVVSKKETKNVVETKPVVEKKSQKPKQQQQSMEKPSLNELD